MIASIRRHVLLLPLICTMAFTYAATAQLGSKPKGANPFGEPIPLGIEGGNPKVIKVPRVVYDDRTSLSVPFKLKADPGAVAYSWQWPDGAKVIRRGNVLEVLSVPNGTHVFVCDASFVDFKAEQVTLKVYEVTVNVGDVPNPPNPPNPPVPPEPDSQLVLDLRAALAKDKATDGDTILAKSLVEVLRDTSNVAGDESKTKSLLDVSAYYRNEGTKRIGTSLSNTKLVLSSYIGSQIGKDLSVALGGAGAANRQKTVMAFSTAASALEKASK